MAPHQDSRPRPTPTPMQNVHDMPAATACQPVGTGSRGPLGPWASGPPPLRGLTVEAAGALVSSMPRGVLDVEFPDMGVDPRDPLFDLPRPILRMNFLTPPWDLCSLPGSGMWASELR